MTNMGRNTVTLAAIEKLPNGFLVNVYRDQADRAVGLGGMMEPNFETYCFRTILEAVAFLAQHFGVSISDGDSVNVN